MELQHPNLPWPKGIESIRIAGCAIQRIGEMKMLFQFNGLRQNVNIHLQGARAFAQSSPCLLYARIADWPLLVSSLRRQAS